MPQISGEGYVSKVGHKNYHMFLVIDGQKKRKPTGTSDPEEAANALEKWKHQVEVGVVGGDARLRYEAIRDNYLAAGKQIREADLRDLMPRARRIRRIALP